MSPFATIEFAPERLANESPKAWCCDEGHLPVGQAGKHTGLRERIQDDRCAGTCEATDVDRLRRVDARRRRESVETEGDSRNAVFTEREFMESLFRPRITGDHRTPAQEARA